jgi:hypothetical protein
VNQAVVALRTVTAVGLLALAALAAGCAGARCTVTSWDVVSAPRATVEGTVARADGRPSEATTVLVLLGDQMVGGACITDAAGRFRIDGIPAARDYRVRIEPALCAQAASVVLRHLTLNAGDRVVLAIREPRVRCTPMISP